MNPRPHRRKKTQHGSSGMKGYSRYGSSGKGLSDKGYASWATARVKAGHNVIIKNPASYLMGMSKLGTPVGWAGKAGYKGSGLETHVQQAAISSGQGLRGITTTYGGGTPGAQGIGAPTGISGGMPSWVMKMLGRSGTSLGRPPQAASDAASIATLGGLAYLVYKVLL